jgi:CPA1 family monovalent cation:H+ antiporter
LGERELQADRIEERLARGHAIAAAIERLEQLGTERGLSDELMQRCRTGLRERLGHFEEGPEGNENQAPPDEIALLLIGAERDRVNELYRQGTLKDEARRRLERELDLREATLANHRHET